MFRPRSLDIHMSRVPSVQFGHLVRNFRGFSALSQLLDGIFEIGQNPQHVSIGPHVCLKGRFSISFTYEVRAVGWVPSVKF